MASPRPGNVSRSWPRIHFCTYIYHPLFRLSPVSRSNILIGISLLWEENLSFFMYVCFDYRLDRFLTLMKKIRIMVDECVVVCYFIIFYIYYMRVWEKGMDLLWLFNVFFFFENMHKVIRLLRNHLIVKFIKEIILLYWIQDAKVFVIIYVNISWES